MYHPNNIFRVVRMKDVNTFLSEMRSSSSEEVKTLTENVN